LYSENPDSAAAGENKKCAKSSHFAQWHGGGQPQIGVFRKWAAAEPLVASLVVKKKSRLCIILY
jgi:hypothetical protein